MKALAASCILLLSLALRASGQQVTDEQLARQFVPESLATFDTNHPGMTTIVSWNILPVDLDHTGSFDYLAIAYDNHVLGALRLVRKGPSARVVAEIATVVSCNGPAIVEAIDLDGDG